MLFFQNGKVDSSKGLIHPRAKKLTTQKDEFAWLYRAQNITL